MEEAISFIEDKIKNNEPIDGYTALKQFNVSKKEFENFINIAKERCKLAITSCPLSDKITDEKLIKMSQEDKYLCKHIENYYINSLKPRQIELFKTINNIIITSNGYYFAHYLKDLTKIPPSER